MDHLQQRREARQLLPNEGTLVPGQLERDRIHLFGRLWNLSRNGCCLCTRSDGPIPATDEQAVLRVSDPGGGEDLELCVRVVWVEREQQTRFLGLEFLAPLDFPATFLASVMRQDRAPVQRS